jgi:hypothetical protein
MVRQIDQYFLCRHRKQKPGSEATLLSTKDAETSHGPFRQYFSAA